MAAIPLTLFAISAMGLWKNLEWQELLDVIHESICTTVGGKNLAPLSVERHGVEGFLSPRPPFLNIVSGRLLNTMVTSSKKK